MYVAGVVVGLLIWFWRIIYAFLQINSQVVENLNLIGKRLSWLDFSVKEITLRNVNEGVFFKIIKFFLLWVLLPLIFVLTSWVYVVYVVGIFVYQKSKEKGMPQELKEYQWKIKNLHLTFDQMVELTFKMIDQKDINIEEFKSILKQNMRERGL